MSAIGHNFPLSTPIQKDGSAYNKARAETVCRGDTYEREHKTALKHKVEARWATVKGYPERIYLRCFFNTGFQPCGWDSGREGTVADMATGDRVQILVGPVRTSGGSDIYEVKFKSWTGWMSATALTIEETE